MLHARGLYTLIQLVLADDMSAEVPKEIGGGEAIGTLQLAVALLRVRKVPQGMGVRMGVMGRG